MDFLDFEGEGLYFDNPVSVEVEQLIARASDAGRDDSAEAHLLRAYFLEQKHLTVHVALYRYYYYTQRFEDALLIVDRALEIAAGHLGLRSDWQDMTAQQLGHGARVSMGMTRFYMLALKASGFILLRMRRIEEALERLNKLAELDPSDQFGAGALKELAEMAIAGAAISREKPLKLAVV